MVAAVTSALGDPTRRQVYLYVRESAGGMTATQVAHHFGLHPNVARHHLDKLAACGYLEVLTTRSRRAGAGRPSKLYRASRADVLGVPARGEDLFLALLEGALRLLTPDEAEEMAEGVGFAYGRNLALSRGPGDGPRSLQAALAAIADALTAHGFAARAEPHGPTLALVQEACPLFDAARQHPVICAVDRGMVRGMLSALYGPALGPTQSSSRALGDAACTTSLPAPAGC